jgi:hypothetical protein
MQNSPNGALWCHIAEGGLFLQTEQCDNPLCKGFGGKTFQCTELKLANPNEPLNDFMEMFENRHRHECRLCQQGTLSYTQFCPFSNSWFINIDFELESLTISDILSGRKTLQFQECSFTLAGLVIYDVKRGGDLYKINLS